MALDRLVPTSASAPPVTGPVYMDAVSEEMTGLWDRTVIKLTGAAGTNSYTATCTPALTGAITDTMSFILEVPNTNTSGVVSLDIGTGAKTIVNQDGAAPLAGQ